jgi:hypothetical protein
MDLLTFIGLPAAAIFCLARGAVDLRQRRYAWGILGLASGLVLLVTPIPTHAVKFDLPRPGQR